jgi:hypothetical protein
MSGLFEGVALHQRNVFGSPYALVCRHGPRQMKPRQTCLVQSVIIRHRENLLMLVVVATATVFEVIGSIIWGVYRYRLGNLPLFVPPGHGLVYLTGLRLSQSQIAAGILRGRDGNLPAAFDSPLTRLRSTLGELLGEHMQLVVDAMGAALRGGPEFRADAAQVNSDTEQLASAIGVLFGPQSATRFESVWGDHVDALVSYSGAVAAEDEQGKAKALAQLRAFERHLSAFLSTGTDGRLTAPALSDVLHMHDRDLVEQIDAYARSDFKTAYSVTYEGYQHMFAVAETLSGAIGPTIAARLPKGGVQTGGGGMAGSR